ncbi:hypothetical protein [Ureibacillus xyleni]|uniref:hypothetical protein n=1 Tax=Ureibacillus xyleni TaxID=614648 RepID=UPI00137B4623|nr:hypothetical protein [Ureibacillus xyleni]
MQLIENFPKLIEKLDALIENSLANASIRQKYTFSAVRWNYTFSILSGKIFKKKRIGVK